MMDYGASMMGNAGIFGLMTWIALLVFLVLGSIYFWKGIDRKKIITDFILFSCL